MSVAVTRVRGGLVVDPACGPSGVRDLWIVNGRMADEQDAREAAGSSGHGEVDASGCHVFPGLVDFHLHMFHGGTEIGLQPDSALLPQGVTMAVDQGSAGVANCEAFFSRVLAATRVRAFAFLHLCPAGLATTRYLENIDPQVFDPQAVCEVFERHPGLFKGLKIRQSREIAGAHGLKPLERTVRLADDLGLPVVVHTTDPAGDIEDLASLLRPGDVFSHVYHGRGQTVLDEAGRVRPGILRARERGVLFDTADGRVHFGFRVIRRALDQGFFPDTISTDLTRINMFVPPVFGLPMVMAKYLALGMGLEDVVRAVTGTPVAMLGLDGSRFGTLRPGAHADLAVFRLVKGRRVLTDQVGDSLNVEDVLAPQMTMLGGRIVHRAPTF